MAGRVLLINPARHFIANHNGLGYLTPLGLISIGGPLIDAGFTVKLIDHDAYGWSLDKLIKEISGRLCFTGTFWFDSFTQNSHQNHSRD